MNPAPRRSSPRLIAVVGVLILAGCGGERADRDLGCFTDDRVPPRERAGIERAAAELYSRARTGAWEDIYRNAASIVRDRQTPEQFLSPLVQVLQRMGFPRLTEETLTLVRFGGDFPPVTPVECEVEGADRPRKLLLDSHPAQASLVQTGAVGGERFFYSTLWFWEQGVWRLATFHVKPATLRGESWEVYDRKADDQRLEGNNRNTALLYNVAIDLLVPNAWTQPPELTALQRKQQRLSVTYLPVGGAIDRWPAPSDTFRVRSVQYTVGEEKLGLVFRHEAVFPVADSTAQKAYADRLFDFIRKSFPEYPEIFDRVVLVTIDPEASEESALVYTYPLGGKR
jgi:hypothetical protein